jgi:hypothetical protein
VDADTMDVSTMTASPTCEVRGCAAPLHTVLGLGVVCDRGHAYHPPDTSTGIVADPVPPPAIRAPSTPLRMSFGKHRGELVEELPSDYISWCLETLTRMQPGLRAEMEAQLAARSGRGIVRVPSANANANANAHAVTRPTRSAQRAR